MPEFRQDPISGRWVIIAEDRAGRPSEFASRPIRHALSFCPFCAGSEYSTPDPIAVYPSDSGVATSWKCRVIPNKYPAVRVDALQMQDSTGSQPAVQASSTANEFVLQPGFGIHEVIIESPDHVPSFTDLTEEFSVIALRAYQDRLHALGREPRLNYALLFKNCRGGSGATLEHVHSQLLATSIVPAEVEIELNAARRYFETMQRCVFCDLMRQEIEHRVRVTAETDRFIALCPFASRFPYETWILPRVHGHRFEVVSLEMLAELAGLMRQVLRSFESLSEDTPYNYWIRTAPFHASTETYFHWRIELIPRVTTQAGYEWGTGCFVNPVSPESAAKQMRAILRSS